MLISDLTPKNIFEPKFLQNPTKDIPIDIPKQSDNYERSKYVIVMVHKEFYDTNEK